MTYATGVLDVDRERLLESILHHRNSLMRQVAVVRRRHYPRTWSSRKMDCPHGFGRDDHEESCFEEITTCNGCGTHYPCTTIREMDEAAK